MAIVEAATTTIRTERLLLRPLRPSDAEPLFALIADWEVVRWLSMPPWPYELGDAHSFIRGQLNQDLAKTTFAITLEDTLIAVIDVRVNPAGHSQSGPGPNLGYWLGRSYWGRGYMTEAARSFVAHVFGAGIGDTVYSGAFADNQASLRVQARLSQLGTILGDFRMVEQAKGESNQGPSISKRL